MSYLNQISQALFYSPFIIVRGRQGFFLALCLYVFLGLIVFGGFSYLLIENKEEIRQAVMSYLLPDSWHSISEWLFNFFFESQTKIVLVSMIITGAMVVASIILFPVKEYCSARFESESNYSNGAAKEFPLWMQALEECKLLALYIAAQSIIFALGYYPYVWCKWASTGLSVLFLCFAFGLDFIAPTLQRHRVRYTSIIKLLSKNWLLTFLFGAFFSIPVLFLGQWIIKIDTLDMAEVAAILFAVNMVVLAIAIPAGTHVASQLLPYARELSPPSVLSKKIAYGLTVMCLITGVSFHGLVGMSMHHKSQLLKCEYDIDFGSIDVAMPNLIELARGEKEVELTFDLNIQNPTQFDLAIEKSHLSVWQNKNLIGRILVTELYVASGDAVKRSMTLKLHLNTQMLSGFMDLLDGWAVQMEFELMPGIPFIVKVL